MAVKKVLISACLLGEKVRYDGGCCRQRGLIEKWQKESRLISFCPEVAAGLPVPRLPAEIAGGNAEAVLCGCGKVCRCDGADVTDAFVDGAELALAECMRHSISIAILKEGSPSCGVTCVRDGTFSKRKAEGTGVTTKLLARHGIHVFSEHQIDAAEACLCGSQEEQEKY